MHCAVHRRLAGHESWVLSVAMHPGGSAFASGGSDACVKLWDINTRTCVQTLSADHTDQVCLLLCGRQGDWKRSTVGQSWEGMVAVRRALMCIPTWHPDA